MKIDKKTKFSINFRTVTDIYKCKRNDKRYETSVQIQTQTNDEATAFAVAAFWLLPFHI